METNERQTRGVAPNVKVMDASSDQFVDQYLPFYTGPHFKYFAKMFDDDSLYVEGDIVTLDELEGVVSDRSFKLLIQWFYVSRIIVSKASPSDEIQAIVEFACLADHFKVEGMEELVAERIKTLIRDNPEPKADAATSKRHPDTNTHWITSQAILWASSLPHNHAVRKILAMAVVEGYLRSGKHKFLQETQYIPNFAIDVLKAVKLTLQTLIADAYGRGFFFKDPISDMQLKMDVGVPKST